jgi:hypothetical protein
MKGMQLAIRSVEQYPIMGMILKQIPFIANDPIIKYNSSKHFSLQYMTNIYYFVDWITTPCQDDFSILNQVVEVSNVSNMHRIKMILQVSCG